MGWVTEHTVLVPCVCVCVCVYVCARACARSVVSSIGPTLPKFLSSPKFWISKHSWPQRLDARW